MWPYVVSAAVGSASHAVTAVRIVLSSMTELRRRTGLGSARAVAKREITIHAPFILFLVWGCLGQLAQLALHL